MGKSPVMVEMLTTICARIKVDKPIIESLLNISLARRAD